MLVLTRAIGELLMIGDDIKVTVLEIRGNQARIGIDAPRDIPVHREEVYCRIAANKRDAIKEAVDEFFDNQEDK